MLENTTNDKNLAFDCGVKAMNDMLEPEGLVPFVLFFGEYPRLPIQSGSKPPRKTFKDCSQIVIFASKEIEFQMASVIIKRALKAKIPAATGTATNQTKRYSYGAKYR